MEKDRGEREERWWLGHKGCGVSYSIGLREMERFCKGPMCHEALGGQVTGNMYLFAQLTQPLLSLKGPMACYFVDALI